MKEESQPNSVNEQLQIDKVNEIMVHISPHLNELIRIFKSLEMHEYEIMLGDGSDKMFWSSGKFMNKSPTQDQLAIEITQILDNAYPNSTSTFMGMIFSENQIIAGKIAEIVAKYRQRDKRQVQSQLIALLAAFNQGS